MPTFPGIVTQGWKTTRKCKDFPLCGNSGAFFVDNQGSPSYDFDTYSSPKRQLVTVYPLPVHQTTRVSDYGRNSG